MTYNLSGKKALITGASDGLGFACAKKLANEGCQVIIVSRNEENLNRAASIIKNDTGCLPKILIADVSKEQDVKSIFSDINDEYGSLDIVIANSGGPKQGRFIDFDTDSWYAAVDNNFMSVVWIFKNSLKLMKDNSSSRLLTITSTGAKQPLDNLILSNTMRSAVHSLVKTLSQELAEKNITVNAISPGRFLTNRQINLIDKISKRENLSFEEALSNRTQQIPMKRMGEPEEFASYIAYLCSDQAGYITGTALNIDGGYLRSI